ncbi:LysR family transcriptional regulator [Pseudomonas fluorescens HK44]|uniref:LysR family transcriptional regulator n=1 Tax=Pseudomonas fluorescens HK44 TaxID=1042209 RepID=A0A010S7W1_PSEFL|nr:LysR family transcriptional regulator [Pseudomonas fluorescens]EXF96514.1 LysR family transcriptional regulator [Pseudomonas fluorescens HK44]
MPRHFDDVQLGSIELFCLAVEFESFTAAAQAAGVTPAAVSRSVSRLEERLAVRLFVRTTRQIRLTEAGRVYYEQCRQALTQLVDAEREVTGQQQAPSGELRISAPTPYAHFRLLPRLAEFRRRYPLVKVVVHVSTRNIDFAEEGYDLAIRGRAPDDSALIARTLENAELVVVASPEYLRQRGAPQALSDLELHDCIQFELPSSGRNLPWTFIVDQRSVSVNTSGNTTCLEDYLATITMARHGAGIVQAYRFTVQAQIESGELVEVLGKFGGATRPFMLLYPHARYLPMKVRALIDFLTAPESVH